MAVVAADPVAEAIALFAAGGGERYLGELVTQSEHALQAAWLAEKEGAAPALIVAALLHDVGHLLHDEGDDAAMRGLDTRHEALGAAFLSRRFATEVVAAVSLHVEAKRYLAAIEPDYAARLSPASALSLQLQGGPMDPAECRRFEAKRAAADAVRLRRWDDAAKTVGLATPGFDHFRPYLEAVVRR